MSQEPIHNAVKLGLIHSYYKRRYIDWMNELTKEVEEEEKEEDK